LYANCIDNAISKSGTGCVCISVPAFDY
jgi:hypothetical protein